jgi:hypothetical protein
MLLALKHKKVSVDAMNKGIHVCIYCGQLKSGPQETCPSCGRTPATQEERNKSLLLSTNYYLVESDYLGKTDEELLAIAQSIRSGQHYQFDEAELQRLNEYSQEVASYTSGELLLANLLWKAPAIIVIIMVIFYYYGKGRWF